MVLNTFTCNYLTPLHFKGLSIFLPTLGAHCSSEPECTCLPCLIVITSNDDDDDVDDDVVTAVSVTVVVSQWTDTDVIDTRSDDVITHVINRTL